KTGILGFDQLMDLMALAPRRRFRIPGGQIEVGQPADLALMDLNDEYAIDSSQFLSMGKSTPFEGMRVQGRTLLTMVEGEVRYAVSG
ncbi:amidohydrolase family protein, partial [Eubacteriales bacterium OttesenSCG-928-N13]|nr:amidohydrolase family protein [Eubacteriales bacterium OttesenSCG-928-N13]